MLVSDGRSPANHQLTSKSPSRRRLRAALLDKPKHCRRTHHENRLPHAARSHLVLLLVGGGDALERRSVFHLFRRAFDDDGFFPIVVRDRTRRIGPEVPALARFSSS